MRTRILLLVAAMFAVLLPSLSAQAAEGEIVTVTRYQDYGWATKTGISDDGHPMIATYRQTASHPIELRTCLNSDCTKARTGTILLGRPYPLFDFAIGADGIPVFLVSTWDFWSGGGDVRVIRCTDIHCRFGKTSRTIYASTTMSPFAGSIVVGANNNPTVTFGVTPVGEGGVLDTTLVSCRDRDCRTSDRQLLGAVRGHDLAVGSNGFPIIARGGANPGDAAKLERCLNARCTSSTTQALPTSGSNVASIAALEGEVTVVAINSGMVERVVCNESRCSGSIVISENGVRATDASVAYVKPGKTVVSYTDNTALDLWMHRCGNSCDSDLLYEGNAGGEYRTGEVASVDGLAYISFHEARGRRLGLATFQAL